MTSQTDAPALNDGEPFVDPKRWWILVVCGLGQLMVVLDLTIVNIALPSAQHSLKFSNDARQWAITAYALAFGSLLLIGGRLADRFGRKPMFMIGMAGFALASAAGGASIDYGMLCAARALQGVFAAILAPSTLSLLTTTFEDPGERGKAFGVFSAVAGSGSAIGLLLGGVLTTYLNWRWCLYVNIIIAAIGLVGSLALLHSTPRNDKVRIDDPGIIAVVLGLVAMVVGFSEAATDGWSSPLCLVPLILSPFILALFVVIERRVPNPVMPLGVIVHRLRGTANLAFLLLAIGLFGVFLFLTYFLEEVIGYSAIRTGLAYLPMTAAIISGSMLTNTRLLPRFGPRWLATAAAVCSGAAMLWLAQLDPTSGYASVVLPGIVVFGFSVGCLFGCCFNMATTQTGPETAGVASALVTTAQQVGGSIGTSLLNTIATSVASSYLIAHTTAAFRSAHTKTITQTAVYASAQVHSYDVCFYTAAGIMFAVAVITAGLFPSGRLAALVSQREAAVAAA